MKRLRKLIGVVLLAAIVFSILSVLTSCDFSNKIIGKWKMRVNFTSDLSDYQMADLQELFAYLDLNDVYFNVIIEFKEDGDYTISADEASISGYFEAMQSKIKAGLKEYYSNEFVKEGLNPDDNSEKISKLVDSTAEIIISKHISSKEILSEYSASGKYEVKEDKLYMNRSGKFDDDSYAYICIKGINLSIDKPTGSNFEEIISSIVAFPVIFVQIT